MKIIYKGASAELVEKKSRFIADISPVKSEAEASAFIDSVKKKYWDCRHNCSAFVIGENPPLTRCSDDGEPAGTAGRPMLEMLLAEGITDVCIVVSRYFGGTLLGTGGLIRAYAGAAKLALESAVVSEKLTGCILSCDIGYELVGKVQYIASQLSLFEMSSEYGERVLLRYLGTAPDISRAVSLITESTAGKALLSCGDPLTYIVAGGSPVLLK